MKTAIHTSDEELLKLVKEGYFFNFCVAFALNKGYRDAMKEKKEIKFSVGDYGVVFDSVHMCFVLSHKEYFARIITAYYDEVVFVGDSEDEVINELLAELQKELRTIDEKNGYEDMCNETYKNNI